MGSVAKSAECDLITYEVLGVGGSAAVTEVTNTTAGVALTWVSTGRVRLTWPSNPGIFAGAVWSFQATTPADVKNYVAIHGAYNTTAFSLDVYLYESGTLTDLAAFEWLNGTVKFRLSAVSSG